MNLSFISNNIFFVEEVNPAADTLVETRKLLIVLQNQESENEGLSTFLRKILSAIKCEIQKDTWCFSTMPEKKISLVDIKRNYPAAFVIVFGVDARHLGFHAQIQKYLPTKVGEDTYLWCDFLSDIEKQTALKAALWDALKNSVL